jgi:tRNA (guanosine-2'-O-)-methyltransferase
VRRDPALTFEPTQYSSVPWTQQWSVSDVIEVLEPLVNDARRSKIQQVLAARLASVTVLLDRPHDPHILRSCDAFGVQALHVIPTDEAFLASNLVAKGAERWLDIRSHASDSAAIDVLKQDGFELVATHPQGALDPEALCRIPKLALVLGNEHTGISPKLEQSAGLSVRIPMCGFVESLNVSVSAALLVRAACQGRPGDLSASDHQRLYARGLYYSVQRARDILAALRPDRAPSAGTI